MKKINIFYWIVTGLFAGMMLFSAVPNIMADDASVKMLHDEMGYPTYIIPFIGVMKLLGAIAILVPGVPRLKEWAYAGLVFDLIGATYSFIALGTEGYAPMFIFIAFAFLSYFLYHRRKNLRARLKENTSSASSKYAAA